MTITTVTHEIAYCKELDKITRLLITEVQKGHLSRTTYVNLDDSHSCHLFIIYSTFSNRSSLDDLV